VSGRDLLGSHRPHLFGNTQRGCGRIAFDDAFLYRELALPLPKRTISASMFLREHAWESFQLWLDIPNKKLY